MIETKLLATLFPFMIKLDKELKLIEIGRSLKTRMNYVEGDHILEHFTVRRPFGTLTYAKIIKNQHRLTLLDVNKSSLQLRGQLVHLETTDEFLFVGSLKINSMADIEQHKLNIGDFSAHDPILDFLFLLNLSGSSSSEAEQTNNRLTTQKQIFETTIDAAPLHIFIMSADRCLIYQNDRLKLTLGTIGISQPTLASVCQPETYQKACADLLAVTKGDSIQDYQLAFRRADGSSLLLHGQLKPLLMAALPPMAIGYFNEVDDLKTVGSHAKNGRIA